VARDLGPVTSDLGPVTGVLGPVTRDISPVTSEINPVAEFIDPDRGDKVNFGRGLSYWPARLNGLAGRYDNPMPESTLSPSQGSMNSATDVIDLVTNGSHDQRLGSYDH
jgi:hypothetical protein